MKNKKGFTLVELLAVIVILALIMGIAVVSIGGVLQSSREKTYRETAASLLNGVRQQLYIENQLAEGYYSVPSTILEKGGKESSFGGTYNYSTETSTTCTGTGKTFIAGFCKTTSAPETCSATAKAYVRVEKDGNNWKYTICLSDGTHYLNAEESTLLNHSATIS